MGVPQNSPLLIMGRFLALMVRFHEIALWAVFPLENPLANVPKSKRFLLNNGSIHREDRLPKLQTGNNTIQGLDEIHAPQGTQPYEKHYWIVNYPRGL